MKFGTTSLLVVSALAFTSCDALPTAGLIPGTGGGGNAMVDAMVSQPAMNIITLPPGAAVGQAWTMTMMGGTEQRTAIVAEQDGMLIVEQPMDMGGEIVVQAFLVDPSIDMMQVVEAGEKMNANVTAAWVGAEGEAPQERPVMEAMTMPEATGEVAPAVDMEQGTETVTLGGRSWDTEWSEVAGSRSWMLAGSTFIVKSVSNGDTVMELTAFDTDAEPALDWEAGSEEE